MKSALATLLLLSSSIALADGPQPTAEQIIQAKEHYFNGEKAYRLGDFDKAISEFRASYDLNPVSKVLFNLGQSHYKKNDLKAAQHFFRQFIETSPNSLESVIAKKKLAEVEAIIKQESSLAKPAEEKIGNMSNEPAIEPSPEKYSPSQPKTRHLTGIGKASLGLLSTSAILAAIGGGLLGHSRSINPLEAPTLAQQQDLDSQANKEKFAGIVILSVGGAALVSGVVTFGIWMHRRHKEFSVARKSHGAIIDVERIYDK